MNEIAGMIPGLVTLGFLFSGYMLPALIAMNAIAIGVLNFFLGWTLIGWVVSLVWAVTHEDGKTGPPS